MSKKEHLVQVRGYVGATTLNGEGLHTSQTFPANGHHRCSTNKLKQRSR